MRKLISAKSEDMMKEQFQVFIEILEGVRSEGDLGHFLANFLSKSESAYLCQRLDIMRMLAKNFTYQQIKQNLDIGFSTITNAQRCLDAGGDELKKIILKYRYKPKANFIKYTDFGVKFPRYPGAI